MHSFYLGVKRNSTGKHPNSSNVPSWEKEKKVHPRKKPESGAMHSGPKKGIQGPLLKQKSPSTAVPLPPLL